MMEQPARPAGDPERQLGRSIYAVFLLAIATAIVGPVLSYESDLAELDATTQAHLRREARTHAFSLERHLELVRAELGVISARAAIAVDNNVLTYNHEALSSTQGGSPLLGTGLALLDAADHAIWRDPACPPSFAELLANPERLARLWTGSETAAMLVDSRAGVVVVPLPVFEGKRLVGSLVALVDLAGPRSPLAGATEELALFDPAGHAILPRDESGWPRMTDLRSRVERMLEERTGMHLDGDSYGVAAPVGRTGLSLLLTARQDALLGPTRGRFVLQLVLVASVQFIAVFVLALFARRTYARFLAAERQVRETATLAALGGAASLIAHEVKNSLNGLGAALSMQGSGGDPALATRTMRSQIDRLRHLATSLLAFGKPQQARRIPTDLRPLLVELIKSLGDLPESDDVEVVLTEGPSVRVDCDPLFLGTALDNLLRNAIEAGAAAKDLGQIASPRVSASISVVEGRVRIVIEDNAGGITPQVRERLFEPFMTGKPKGIGLGLTMAFRAVAEQGGELSHEPIVSDGPSQSCQLRGSRFLITLPLGEAP
jgi:signal transduction histidine kinase